jgi:cyclophilin family peptidyl-prolyl cis-trans isomerase
VVFGTVISGFDAVNSIAALPTTAQGSVHIINNPPVINSVTLQ